jgi:hypothetical protein
MNCLNCPFCMQAEGHRAGCAREGQSPKTAPASKVAARKRSLPLEVCPFCLPMGHLFATAEREEVHLHAYRAPGPLQPKKEGPWVIAAKHRPKCPRGRWCPDCGADFWANPAEGILAWMGICQACELRQEAEQEKPGARLARAQREHAAQVALARAREEQLAGVLREKLRAVGAVAYLGHVDGEGGLPVVTHALANFIARLSGLEPDTDPTINGERCADLRALWEALRAVTDLALHRAGSTPAPEESR